MTGWRMIGILFVLPMLHGIHRPRRCAEPVRLNENGFPLAVGNRWNYQVSASRFSINPDETYAFEAEAIWEIVAREQVLGQEAFRFVTTHRFFSGPDSGSVATAETWSKACSVTARPPLPNSPPSSEPDPDRCFRGTCRVVDPLLI